MTPEDTKAQVLRLVRANPRMTAAQVARAIKVSRQRVHKILSDAGFKLECEWREEG
jgi:DNA-directed RNA polymerase sigma subunit (sigma70/sigma32)